MVRQIQHKLVTKLALAVLSVLSVGVATASATTRIMPDRLAFTNEAIVLWGNTTLADGTALTLDCGNGQTTAGVVADESYIFRSCTYTAAGNVVASLTVGGETANVDITVVDPTTLTAAQQRDANINMAIQDGLRFLYFNQFNRAVRYATNMTSWTNQTIPNQDSHVWTALALLAIMNHGHSVLADPNVDIFQTVVQRGLNFLFDSLAQQTLTCIGEPGHPDPTVGVCVNVPAPIATGLRSHTNTGYSTPIIGGAIGAASAVAPNRLVDAGLGSQNANFVAGKTYAEITQRIANTVMWGQSDTAPGRGGWWYTLEAGSSSDGSTVGWGLLGLIDMSAGGATIPAGSRSEVGMLVTNQINADGSFDYQVNAATTSDPAMTRVGIGLQALAYAGVPGSDPRVATIVNYIVTSWNTNTPFGDTCTTGTPTNFNKGCAYSMFNIFKGLRLYGINSIGIGDPDGAGPLGSGDWYGDYVNNLLSNQKNVFGDATRGEWSINGPAGQTGGGTVGNTMGFSCCHSDTNGITSIALLILAPTAFVPPDPGLFSKVGLSPQSDSNPPGTDHTVTATAQSAGGNPVPGVTIDFKVLTGPNANKTGSAVTNATGQATFTYNDDSVAPWPQTDTIQASIGSGPNILLSNIVSKTWQPAVSRCDVAPAGAPNGIVDQADLNAIRAKNGQVAAGPSDPFDGNGDGLINVADVRYCQLRLGPVGAQ
jgi:hypothetical protein